VSSLLRFLQLAHGFRPSHFSFLFLQPSQALAQRWRSTTFGRGMTVGFTTDPSCTGYSGCGDLGFVLTRRRRRVLLFGIGRSAGTFVIGEALRARQLFSRGSRLAPPSCGVVPKDKNPQNAVEIPHNPKTMKMGLGCAP
jgi:hypothetical protein